METIDHSVDLLWQRFKENGDREARDRLVLQYSPLVKYVAGRVRSGLPSSVDQNDLVSDGVIGLMDAIDKFDPARGLQFQTYAVSRIRGAIVDGLRASDWVPRSVREKIRDIDAAQARLERSLGRPPKDPEVAAELGISVEELRAMYSQTAHTSVVSFEGATLGDEDTPRAAVDLPDGDDDIPAGFLAAVRELPERDQIVVALYYWDRLTLAEIGQVLGVTESRVSQLHSRATMTLRRKLLDAAG
ncbi:FliA/WhiG family RNA polymerase sigma factor [Nocardioides panaciterrulae]|uniref:RNA polymerase sigma factor for flagellar operon FliA n=1 Tax=Nocardioides panaciterrulae TaxID=661492 RepID=A0A7Y9E7Y0_9ACTN|nr:FliA/WhiG family RNA polymerase sigma factor [Nocardioides panaciterrulae]NYD42881.1 RNA polymerase sigma factor for flagellar operon FliA [Nocardioides panaciterrulae]